MPVTDLLVMSQLSLVKLPPRYASTNSFVSLKAFSCRLPACVRVGSNTRHTQFLMFDWKLYCVCIMASLRKLER